MNLLTILIVVGIILLVIGATQRKKLLLWIRSETNAVLKDMINTIKVLEVRISDAKSSINTMVDNAGELYAQEQKLIKTISELKDRIGNVLNEARVAKADNKPDVAKTKLSLKISLEKELELCESNLDTVQKSRVMIENKISKLKAVIAKYEIRIQGLKARQSVNNAIKSTNSSILSIGDTDLESSIGNVDDKITAEEFKLEYVTGDEEEDYSEEIEKEFKDLK